MGLADAYAEGIRSAESSATAAEPEAQLTVPLANLLTSLAAEAGLGDLQLIREAQLPGVRPDFAAAIGGRPCGWVELKAPGHTVDGDRWVGRERSQWELLAELDSLIVTDGQVARLYFSGNPVLDASLPWDGSDVDWDREPLIDMLRAFVAARPATVTTASDLATRLAALTSLLRDRLLAGLNGPVPSPPIAQAMQAWRQDVHEGVDEHAFASDVAQVVAYALAIAALSGQPDRDSDGYITLDEAREALRGQHALLAAALGPVIGVHGLTDAVRAELGAIERLVSAIDAQRIARSTDHRGEPWLWFYEDFLARYDPAARRQAGVYYTPIAVVKYQVRQAEAILVTALNRELAFADSRVVTLDPATGSGTYPLAIIDSAAQRVSELRGPAGARQAAANLAENLVAFELLPGPYSVAHLRIGQRLAEIEAASVPRHSIRVYLTDTLADPADHVTVAPGLWGDAETLATERSRAAAVKRDERITVVIGNPPYARRTAASGGGWVLHPESGRALFEDLLEGAREHGVIFSAQASLYNDYVYFWRWAMWKALEQTNKPAVISFITASSWLSGAGFVGLRALAQSLATEIWVTDLGGENRGAVTEENVFAIQTPVAIVTLFRQAGPRSGPPIIRYRRVEGSRSEKLSELDNIPTPFDDPDAWVLVDAEPGGSFLPNVQDATWTAFPLLTDLFPLQQPGAKYNRAWPIAVSPDVLRRRWEKLVSEPDLGRRGELFVTASTGRTVYTTVGGSTRIADLRADSPPEAIVRYAFRPFDRQWTFKDARLANLERPALWRSRSDKQIFMIGMLTRQFGHGPALTVSVDVPDLHAFQGSYGGKDVIPLYRDAAGNPNITFGLLETLEAALRTEISPEDLAAYVFAVTAHRGYTQRFAADLGTPGLRVPVTRDPDLFRHSVEVGRRLIHSQTYGQRLGAATTPQRLSSVRWMQNVSAIPSDPSAIVFDEATSSVRVGDGLLEGVTREAWEFSVSGYEVIPKWFQWRTRTGIGRASSQRATPLDRVRPAEWEDAWNDEAIWLVSAVTASLSIAPEQAALLEAILDGPIISATELPSPTAAERAVPRAMGEQLAMPDEDE